MFAPRLCRPRLQAALVALLLFSASCSLADLGAESDSLGLLESYGIDPEIAEDEGKPEGWPLDCELPRGARALSGGSGTCDAGPYMLLRCQCSTEPKTLLRHFETQATRLGHESVSFELSPGQLSGSTASSTQSMVLQTLRQGGKTLLYVALVEERDEFYRPGRSISFTGINELPSGFPSDRLPLMDGARIEYAYFHNTSMVELNYTVKGSADKVRDWYRTRLGSLGFQHFEEIGNEESGMSGDTYSRGQEAAMLEVYPDGKSCRLVCSYGDGTASIWD